MSAKLFDNPEAVSWEAWEAFRTSAIFTDFMESTKGVPLTLEGSIGTAWRFGFWCALKSIENGTVTPLDKSGPAGNN